MLQFWENRKIVKKLFDIIHHAMTTQYIRYAKKVLFCSKLNILLELSTYKRIFKRKIVVKIKVKQIKYWVYYTTGKYYIKYYIK